MRNALDRLRQLDGTPRVVPLAAGPHPEPAP
jgi:hypothetical protein